MATGTNLIAKALGQFEAVKEMLQKGIEKNETEIAANQTEIARLTLDSDALKESVDKAKRASKGIDKLLQGE